MNTEETKLKDQKAIDKFRDLVKDVNICMFTTLDETRDLSSRPMYTSLVDDGGNVWFFTNEFSEKINEVSKDNLVHLIYSHPVKNIYVDVKGTCRVIIDKKKMEELWEPVLKSWFPQELNDPKLCLVQVETETAHFWNHSSSKMGLIFHMIRSIATGDRYKATEKGNLELSTTQQEM